MKCATSPTTFDAFPQKQNCLNCNNVDEIKSTTFLRGSLQALLSGSVKLEDVKISSARTIGMGKTFSSEINAGNCLGEILFLMTCVCVM